MIIIRKTVVVKYYNNKLQKIRLLYVQDYCEKINSVNKCRHVHNVIN